MLKSDYFKMALKEGWYRDRQWILRVNTIQKADRAPTDTLPGFKEGQFYILLEGAEEPITDTVPDQPLFPIKEVLSLTPDDLKCVKEPITTNYGEATINAIIFEYGSAGKLPFIRGEITGKLLSKVVARALETDVITVDDYLRIIEGMNFITMFADIHVVAYTPRSLQASPEALRIRDELLAKFKDQLHDPAIVAMIDEAIVAADKEFMEGDPAAKFYLADKAYAVVRKKLFHVQGGLTRLDDPSKMDYIPRSLDEGYAPEDLPAIINSLRSGSYDRGASTALGGEAAKFSNRVFQNLKIAEEDCGTKVGKPETVSAERNLVGRYIVGRDTPITEAEFETLIGKRIILRDPTGCKTANRAYCGKCMGDKEVESELGLGPRLSEVCSVFLSVSLAAFHSVASKLVVFDPSKDIH